MQRLSAVVRQEGDSRGQAIVPQVSEFGCSAFSASKSVGMVAAGHPPLSLSLRELQVSVPTL
jgi:hypothetical protein